MTFPKKTDQKLISIIMATYNCGQKIENTLQSIFSQNRDLFELIILDGSSTDDTLNYIKKYENSLTLISEADNGIYDAFNKGVELAQGKYLYFIGAGDCFKPGILDEIKKFLCQDIPGIVYGQVFLAKHKKCNGRKFSASMFIRDNLCQQSMFYHQSVFKIIGNFDLEYKVFADWMFNTKCFINDRIEKKYVDIVIADYEEGGISSVIENDLIFKKEFPIFVRKQFGYKKYLLCKLFFIEPYIFNCVYDLKFHYLPEYLRTNYVLPGYLAAFLKRFVHQLRLFKKGSKSKN